eukprot:CAMPEP_0119052366 /NCGR_PEP_ID=MMETSP1177-20130426/73689_1 /TAXON_ID=2985 /ORGANISM="Ochromonas sp, Strain CCMP1899" /LENGTH=458 /DNA_ID=CAMNT_0007031911 /DNA_START=271 /DNA_END=1644 /DNA_ORIENTATION=+
MGGNGHEVEDHSKIIGDLKQKLHNSGIYKYEDNDNSHAAHSQRQIYKELEKLQKMMEIDTWEENEDNFFDGFLNDEYGEVFDDENVEVFDQFSEEGYEDEDEYEQHHDGDEHHEDFNENGNHHDGDDHEYQDEEEHHDQINEDFDQISEDFDQINEDFDQINEDFEEIEQEIDQINEDFEEIEQEMESCSSSDGDTLACQEKVRIAWGTNEDGSPPLASAECIDRRDYCPDLKNQGECDASPGWMIMNCPLSCNVCHLRDPAIRCAREGLNMTLTPAYKPGDLDTMVNSIVYRFGGVYNINVLSKDPWVVTLDNFLTDSEVNALITEVKGNWEHSTDTGLTNEFGETGRILSTGRTSSNAWCQRECEQNPEVKKIVAKIEDVTNVPKDNFESFQILKYELGQKYTAHHDADQADVNLACGPRILTFFLYLSDVEEGGETNFPLLNISVKPKKGRALLW